MPRQRVIASCRSACDRHLPRQERGRRRLFDLEFVKLCSFNLFLFYRETIALISLARHLLWDKDLCNRAKYPALLRYASHAPKLFVSNLAVVRIDEGRFWQSTFQSLRPSKTVSRIVETSRAETAVNVYAASLRLSLIRSLLGTGSSASRP